MTAIGSTILALLLLFGIYNSAMLWEINNQKTALAAANMDLQKKTEELHLSNESLKKSNQELEKKTKEAEKNLAEANKQKKIAEENLQEATTQKKNAEANLKEANRQKKLAEENMKEAQKQEAQAEENLQEAQKQEAQAKENLAEAEKQKKLAEENATEAEKQKNVAQENEREAKKQKSIAEENAREAEAQKGIAEANMIIAQENEAKANEANRNLRIKNSELLAREAMVYLENDNVYSAVATALEALPQEGEAIPPNAVAEYVLTTATNAYSSSDKMVNNKINLSSYVEFLEFSEDGTRLFAADNMGNIYVIDYERSAIIKTYTPLEAFGETNETITDIAVDGNNGLVFCNGYIASINLKDASINWRYDTRDVNGYIYGKGIVTNPKADYIFIPDSSSYTLLTKNGQVVLAVGYREDVNYKYDIFDENAYMGADGTVYILRTDIASIQVIKPDSNKLYPIEDAKGKLFAVGEHAECIFLNMGVAVEDSVWGSFGLYDECRLLCLNKKDMSVKWSTNYKLEDSVSGSYCNTIFDFTCKLRDENDEYQTYNGILVVCDGQYVLCFDKQTGELYYKGYKGNDDPILSCVPNTTEYSIKIATPKHFVPKAYLARNLGGEYGDELMLINYYTFDKEREFVAVSKDDKFALASENSSEINIYHQASPINHYAFKNYPVVEGNLDFIVDDGQGTFAAYYYDYVDNVRENHVVIYDAKKDVCKAIFKEELDVETMAFKNGKLLMFDSEGNSKVADSSGQILEEFDLKEKIRSAAGFDASDYIYIGLDPCIYLSENNIVLCISKGIFTINLSQENVVVKEVISGNDLENYCISDSNLVSFTVDSYKNNATKIAYFSNEDGTVYYVSEGGKPVEFIRDSISSVANTTVGNKIAFISKEGYIGIYRYGGESIMKISLQQDSASPLRIRFTPDGQSLIAMCADGRFIKMNVDSGEVIGEYKAEIDVSASTVFEFMDGDSFYIRKYASSSQIVVVDCDAMEKIAEVENYVGYLPSERKILCRCYVDGEYEIGYYKYLTTTELMELAKTFLKGN